jgi:hypothetical protein
MPACNARMPSCIIIHNARMPPCIIIHTHTLIHIHQDACNIDDDWFDSYADTRGGIPHRLVCRYKRRHTADTSHNHPYRCTDDMLATNKSNISIALCTKERKNKQNHPIPFFGVRATILSLRYASSCILFRLCEVCCWTLLHSPLAILLFFFLTRYMRYAAVCCVYAAVCCSYVVYMRYGVVCSSHI